MCISVPLIDELLETIQKRTSVVCVNSAGIRETFRVAVALINRIYIPDMDSPDL
ncbi:hypothetical protein DPMN_008051 [Dreissena polymorpha]|uniref:Uncharacterized protein n=1 Tax=Dreissena polymorpha TaxID=45954 RepID=A0A9D4MYH4_DREPO|nr:hypothetical protein DPMN_008051 [Dreissena polymorpha]